MIWRKALAIYLGLIIIDAVNGCSLEEILPKNKLLGCIVGGKNLLQVDRAGDVPNITECLFEHDAIVTTVRCVDSQWIHDTDNISVQHLRFRRKRSWGRFFRSVGNFFKGVGQVITGVVRGVSCVLTLFSCLWADRAGPPPDRTSPNLDCPEPYVTGIAEPFQTYAKVSWREPGPAKDDRDGNITPRRYGRAPGRHFPEGLNYVEYRAKDKSGNEAKCTVTVDVKVIRCPAPKSVSNGYYICHPSTDFVLSGQCRFGCYDGFDLDGPGILTCQNNSHWTAAQPKCKPWKCPELPTIEGSSLTCTNDNYFRSICTYTCRTGYDMPPKVSKALVCTINKTWRTHGDPKCIDVEPPEMTSCPSIVIAGTDTGVNTTKVTWKLPIVKDNSGYNIQAKHISGPDFTSKLTAGKYTVTYGASDETGNEARQCRFNIVVRDIRCPKLYPTPYVQINCKDGYRTGAICDVKCDPGKTIKGGDLVKCNKNPNGMYGEWNWKSGHQTTCSSSHSCVSRSPPKNGAIACDNWLGGEFCQVQCKQGTDMGGVDWKKLQVCTNTGDWTPAVRIRPCRDVRRPHTFIGVMLSYYYHGDCTDESTKTEIRNNFIKVLNSSLYRDEACPDSIECNPENVQVTCGEVSRKRRDASDDSLEDAVSMKIELSLRLPIHTSKNDSFVTTHDNGKYIFDKTKSVARADTNSIFGGTSIQYIDIYSRGIDVTCPLGAVKAGQSINCVDCPEGTYYRSSIRSCESCRKGTYQDEGGQMSCKRCAAGTTTRSIGSMATTDCEDACLPGSFSKDGVFPCSPCEIGYFQASEGQSACHKCNGAKSTFTVGSDKRSDCQEFDIQFPAKTNKKAAVYMKTPIQLTDFTIAFWLQTGIFDTLTGFGISMSDNNGTVVWKLTDLNHIMLANHTKMNTRLYLPDDQWHYIFIRQTSSCNITAYLDGIKVSSTTHHGVCNAIDISEVDIEAGDGFEGAISQLNIWKHSVSSYPPIHARCVGQHNGDLLAWQSFGEANISGAYVHMPSQCDDFDNCVSSPCFHGNCSDELHGFQCSCHAGYTGLQCETNVDDCEVNICINNSTCIDGVSNYTCMCPDNYTGQFCEVELVDGHWSEWGNWSECSTTCGDGENRRIRLCNNPTPDNGGENCVGSDVDVKDCNNTECPVCAEIYPPDNGTLNCVNDTDSINCTIACNDGFDFDREPLPAYFCGPDTFNEWNFQTVDNSERRLPKCTEIQVPEKITVHYTARYQNLYCINSDMKSEAEDNINAQVKNVVAQLPCIAKETCTLDHLQISNCDVSKRKRRAVDTVAFTVSISSQPHNDNDTDSLDGIQNAFTQIQGAADNGEFTVDVLDDDYELKSNATSVSGDIKCGPGTTRVKFYCIPCGYGSYLYDDYCKSCDFGAYQDIEGQSSCKYCPDGKTTTGVGSTNIADCSVDTLQAPEAGQVIGIVLGCSAAVVVIILAVFIYRRYRSKLDKLVEPSDISQIPPPKSSLGTDRDITGPSKPKFISIRPTSPSPTEVSTTSSGTGSSVSKTVAGYFTSTDGKMLHGKPWR